MYAIYGNIYHQYTPFLLAYIPAPWILWVNSGLTNGKKKSDHLQQISGTRVCIQIRKATDRIDTPSIGQCLDPRNGRLVNQKQRNSIARDVHL
jgi:hypothetical protein